MLTLKKLIKDYTVKDLKEALAGYPDDLPVRVGTRNHNGQFVTTAIEPDIKVEELKPFLSSKRKYVTVSV